MSESLTRVSVKCQMLMLILMLNNSCFPYSKVTVYRWKWQCFIGGTSSSSVHLTLEFILHRSRLLLKIVWMSDKSWEPDHTLTLSLSHSLESALSHSRHTEQLLFLWLCSKVTLSLSHSLTLSFSLFLTLTLFQSLIHSLSTCSNVALYRWKWQCFFWTTAASPSPVSLKVIEMVPS